MKKLLASILAVVYLFTSFATVYGGSACPECRNIPKYGNCCLKEVKADCCKSELKYVRTEEHQQASAASYKQKPFFPSVIPIKHILTQGYDTNVPANYSFRYTPGFTGDIPLFVRNCNFRI